MLNSIIRWFYRSTIGQLYLNFLIWIENRREAKQIKKRVLDKFKFTPTIVKNQAQEKIHQGVMAIKNRLNSRLDGAKTVEEREEILQMTHNLLKLSEGDNTDKIKFLDNLKSVYIYKGADVKTETDQAKMIEKRITHFYELQRYKEERKLLKKIRTAKDIGEKDLATTLQKEWKEKYGNKKAKTRRY